MRAKVCLCRKRAKREISDAEKAKVNPPKAFIALALHVAIKKLL